MYTSTRRKLNLNASNCILKGISDDGGLFIVNDFAYLKVKLRRSGVFFFKSFP